MTRRIAVLLGIAVLFGCSDNAPAPDASEESAAQANAAPAERAQTSATATGLRLFMHEFSPSAGELRKPTVMIEADAATQAEGGQWSVDEALFTFYRGDTENLTLRAGHAEIDETNESAQLSRGVHGQAGEVTLEIESIRWVNETRQAHSDGAVTVRQGETWVQASSATIDANEESIICRNGQARFVMSDQPL